MLPALHDATCHCGAPLTRHTWTQDPLPNMTTAGYGEAKTYTIELCDHCWTARVLSIEAVRPLAIPKARAR